MKQVTILFLIIPLFSCENDSYFKRGVKKYRGGYPQEALALFTKEIEANPDNGFAYYERGNSKYALNDRYGALRDMDTAIEIDPHPSFFNNRSVIYSDVGDYNSAIQDASKAIKLKEDYAMAYLNRGGAFGMLNQNEKAIKDYTAAISLEPDNIEALLKRGIVYQKLDNLEKACEDWGAAADLGGKNSMSFYRSYCE